MTQVGEQLWIDSLGICGGDDGGESEETTSDGWMLAQYLSGEEGVCDYRVRLMEGRGGMKDSVEIIIEPDQGISTTSKIFLRRDQVEKAWKELNAPDPPPFKPGDIVKFKLGTMDNKFVVVDDYAAMKLTPNKIDEKDITVISLTRGSVGILGIENLEKVER